MFVAGRWCAFVFCVVFLENNTQKKNVQFFAATSKKKQTNKNDKLETALNDSKDLPVFLIVLLISWIWFPTKTPPIQTKPYTMSAMRV